jgi:hypothetical protein
MKKTLFCLAAACIFAVAGFAQTYGTSAPPSGTQATTDTQSTESKAGAAKERTITGCVEASSEANEYMLKTHGNKKVELITTEDLKPHVGHTVKVSGNWSSEAQEKHEMGGATAEKGEHKEAAGERHFKVDKLEMVSDTCTMGKSSSSGMTPKQ